MKVRTGFVSNSSTTSFCIFGIEASEDELLQELIEKNEEEDTDYSEVIEKMATKAKLDHYDDYNANVHYIGLEWRKIGDKETGAEFKAKVKEKIKKAFPKYKGKCSTWEQTIEG